MKKVTSILVFLLLTHFSSAQEGWNAQDANLTTNAHGAIYPINENLVCAITDNGMFYKTLNGGENWSEQNLGIDESFYDINFYDANFGIAVGSNGTLIKTDNGGNNWTLVATGTTEHLTSIYINNPNSIWVVGDNGVLLFSDDNGEYWTLDETTSEEKLNSVVFKDENNGFIAGDNGTLLKTTNAGISWSPISLTSVNDLFSISISENNIFFLSGDAGDYPDYYHDANKMFKTSDGMNWTSNDLDFYYPGLSKLFFQNDGLGFCILSNSTVNGDEAILIKKTIDSGETWIDSFNGWDVGYGVGISYADIKFVTNDIGYALSGNNILKTIDGGTFVSINEFENNSSLSIYPNPAKTQVQINSPMCTIEQVEILDVTGKIVKRITVLDKQTTIDLKHQSKGIYFIKAITKKGVITKKIVVEK